MIYKEIDKLIAEAMKAKNEDLLRLYRLIKTEFMKLEKGEDKIEITEAVEAKVLLKMAAQREDSIRQYIDGGRPELAKDEQAELDYLKEMLPKQTSDEDIENYTRAVITAYKTSKVMGYNLSMKDMKPIMTLVQEKYPSATGGIISKVLKSCL